MRDLLTLLVGLGLAQPVMEYIVHILVHRWKDPLGYHWSHHTTFNIQSEGERSKTDTDPRKEYNEYDGDMNTYLVAAAGYYFFPQLLLLWLMIAKYEVTHMVLHKYPRVFPGLTAHHAEHHRVATSNFCVSATWPDTVFCTWRQPQIARVERSATSTLDVEPMRLRSGRLVWPPFPEN